MDVELFGYTRIDVAKEREKFLMAMSCFALRQYLSGGDVKGCK